MGFLRSAIGLAALCASIVHSSPATYTTGASNDLKLAVGVPSSVASAGSGDVYLQLSAPTSYRWVAMGIGSQMSGSTIFLIYADGSGNVTASPRDGSFHVEPQYDSGIKVELLAGSGISGKTMTANIKYSLPSGLLKTTSTSTNWIAAWQSGEPLDSKSTSATITQHDAHDQFTFDLTKAVISSDANPYVSSGSSSASASQSGTASATGSSPSATSSGDSGSSGSSGSSGGNKVKSVNPAVYQTAHGVMMAASFVVLLPFGAIVMSLLGNFWAHAVIQMITFFTIIAAFGVGIYLAKIKYELFNVPHTILGLVIVILLLFQPVIGYLHHRQYRKLGRRSYFGHGHIWYGRFLIVLGVINGGLGLRLAGNSKKGEIAYAAVAAVVFVLYVASALIKARRGAGEQNGVRRSKPEGDRY